MTSPAWSLGCIGFTEPLCEVLGPGTPEIRHLPVRRLQSLAAHCTDGPPQLE
jgi:hypothetical protein